MSSASEYWPRAIALVDMNAFFASIEQRDNPKLKQQPVAIINGLKGTCIITSSYEARAYGIKTGMRLPEAKLLCPHLTVLSGRPRYYSNISSTIMDALSKRISPEIEIFSVDEAFLEITHSQHLLGPPAQIAQLIQKVIYDVSELPCSIGIAANKAIAKFAAELDKPNGIVIIPERQARDYLAAVPVTKLCGIGPGIAKFLAKYGVTVCGDMQKLPISVLAQRFGDLGRRIWLMCHGLDLSPVCTQINSPKSMGHGKVLPPDTDDPKLIALYLQHLCERLTARLRKHRLVAQTFFIGLKNRQLGWLGSTAKTAIPTNNGKTLFYLGKEVIKASWHKVPVYQIQITALNPTPENQQGDLFTSINLKQHKLDEIIDSINQKFGEATIKPAPLLRSPDMSPVIAPAWKPQGPRRSV